MQSATPVTTNHPHEPHDPAKHPSSVGEGAPKQDPKSLKELAQKLVPDVAAAMNEKARLEREAFRALPRWQRIKIIARKFWIKGWAKLGFGICAWPHPPYDKKFARDYLGTETRIKLRLYERLQLIISGRLVIKHTMMTYPHVKRSKSQVAISVLPPGVK